jgi:hypothetical protein
MTRDKRKDEAYFSMQIQSIQKKNEIDIKYHCCPVKIGIIT